MSEKKKMRPIWYFVGLLFISLGLVITGTGIYFLFVANESTTVLQDLHSDIWWGSIMLLFGFTLFWFNKGVTVE